MQPVLNPAFLSRSLSQWLGYVPTGKITMGNDATSIEMAAGAVGYSRSILAQELTTLSASTGIDEKRISQIATDMLHNNAVSIYKIGKTV